ncbi:MAG: hypothetical protein ACXW50_24210, partial [Candidatus Binatia bacterium]
MAKNGFRAFDSDMHVFEPADLYKKYMNPKWGDRIPVGQPRTKHGMTRYFLGNGEPIRKPSNVVEFHETRMADRFNESLARDYDNVSQLAAMDKEGLDIAVLFRTSPLHANEHF